MISHSMLRALAASLSLAATPLPALADIKDYEFLLAEREFKEGSDVVVAVHLVDRRSGALVPDAVIFASRLDMQPDGMATMTSGLAAMPSTEPGKYRFKADLSMEGGWRLSLAAKLQGEEGTLEGRLVLRAIP